MYNDAEAEGAPEEEEPEALDDGDDVRAEALPAADNVDEPAEEPESQTGTG